MSELKYPICENCNHQIKEGRIYVFNEYMICQKCIDKNIKGIDPLIKDLIDDFFFDFREDVRDLIELEEE